MSLRLRNPKELPPNGYPYEEHGRRFPPMVSFAFQVSEILTFRKTNNLPRATAIDVEDDLTAYTCRLNSAICYDSNAPRTETNYRATVGCGSCGGSRA